MKQSWIRQIIIFAAHRELHVLYIEVLQKQSELVVIEIFYSLQSK
jgi:hypothetical protein